MTVSLFSNLPAELVAIKQWCLWRYEDVGAAKPTKVPYQPNGKLCSVSDSSTWSAFQDCFNVFNIGNFSGIGFIFTDNDNYTFIDLDDAEGDDAVLQRQLKVYHEFDSYSEVSPSGKGLHIIVKGKIPAGRRRSKIEVYSSQRYATMTGNIYNNKLAINERQDLLTRLWEQMGNGPVAQSMYNGSDKEKDNDETIIRQARDAVNGDKFNKLLSGEWKDNYQSQSEADFAFVDIISFYTQNRNQIARIFRSSALGNRDKAKRQDYVNSMITRSFDRMLPPLDFDGLKNAVELKLSVHSDNDSIHNNNTKSTGNGIDKDHDTVAQRLEPFPHKEGVAGSNPASITTPNTPPGLLGEIATFIYNAAPRPVPEVALAASIGLLAGICGRAYNISGTGLNQYVLLLAMTGAGKEAAASGINKLMNTIKMQVPTSSGFIGPSEISSGSALFKYLGNQSQSFISLLGEFGLRLQQMSSPNANGSEVSLRRMFLDLYNKSGYSEILHASVYSDKANNTSAVPSPSFSILGESTPERFYGALNEDMISEGLLPRFLLIEYKGNRPALNETHTSVIPSFSLVEKLAALAAQCETINHSNPRRVVNVQSTPEAAKLLYDFDKYSDNRINSSNKEVIRQLWNRAHIKVLKLSALIAVGENMIEPTIEAHHMKWAADMVQSDIQALTERFEAGEIGANTFEVKQAGEILRVIRDYIRLPYSSIEKYSKFPTLHADKIIPYVYIQRRLVAASAFRNDRGGPTIAVKRAIQNLVDADRIKEASKQYMNDKHGTNQRCFVVHDVSILD